MSDPMRHPLADLLTGGWRWLEDPCADLVVLLRSDGLAVTLWGRAEPAVTGDGWRIIADAINATTTTGLHRIEVSTETSNPDRDPGVQWTRRVVSARVVRV